MNNSESSLPGANGRPQGPMVIGFLSTSAVILLVGLLVMQSRPTPALAEGMTVLKDDFVMTVGSVTRNDEEIVYLIDASQNKMNVYRFDHTRKEIVLIQSVSLKEMREQASADPTKKPQTKKGGKQP